MKANTDLYCWIGSAKVTDDKGNELDYVGELDMDGKACGNGIATSEDKNFKREGTFFENKFHGLGN